MTNKIDSFTGKYRFLSNFFGAPITYAGLTFKTNEAAFQAMKCDDPTEWAVFADMSAFEAKKCGRIVKRRKDWDEVKLDHMEHICRRKFEQYPGLRSMLIATGDAILEEGNTWGDTYWGTVDGVGENHLGKILMKIRDEYRRNK